MANRNVVVVGGSAGAGAAVARILTELPADFPGTVFVALHLAPTSGDWLAQLLARTSKLPVVCPDGEQQIDVGVVYVARPDRHLIVKDGRVLVSRGPHENMWRPAIDVLFRSAAVAYGHRVVGVLTSGELDDGTSGLQAIKDCGGITVVQDPDDASHPAMLRTALVNVEVDHTLPLGEIAPFLIRVAQQPAGPAVPVPPRLVREARMVELPNETPAQMKAQGSPDLLSCPNCGGPLWRESPEGRMRCLVGHSFQLKSLACSADTQLEHTLWTAIRMFEQRVNISRMLADQERTQGRERRAQLHEARADDSHRHAQTLRQLQEGMQLLLERDSRHPTELPVALRTTAQP